MNAIVYQSNTGHTRAYAQLLGQETGLPVYALAEASKVLPRGEKVLFLGWLMAGQVKGYQKAAKLFEICCLCGVGMAANGSQVGDIRKGNRVPEAVPVFSLQGGFEMEKLHGIYKLMMTTMKKTLGKTLAEKPNQTPEEAQMLELLLHGGDCVCKENLAPLLDWYRGR